MTTSGRLELPPSFAALAGAHQVRSGTLADDADLELVLSDDSSDSSGLGPGGAPGLSDAAAAAAELPGTPADAARAAVGDVGAGVVRSNGNAAGAGPSGARPAPSASASVSPSPAPAHAKKPSHGASTPESKEHRRNFSGDPDYEVPEGTLTETRVLLTHPGPPLHLDRYGFMVPDPATASTSAGSSDAARGADERVRDERHVRKWRKMLGAGGADFAAYLARKPAKVKRRTRKGIPEEMRGLAWQLLSGGRPLLLQNPGKFAALQEGVSVENDTSIMRDLNRTFPNHILFMQRQGIGQRSLYYVLRAYATYDSQVGYVQGMGFVVAVLVMYMTEEEAFWTLVALMRGGAHPPLEGLYTYGMPTLRLCLFQFQELVKAELPALAAHFATECLEPALYATCWFNTVFSYTLPAAALLRVWDVFMAEGMRVVFRVGLALLKRSERKLLAAGFEGMAGMLSAKALPQLVPPPDELIKVALKISLTKRLQRTKLEYDEQERGRPQPVEPRRSNA